MVLDIKTFVYLGVSGHCRTTRINQQMTKSFDDITLRNLSDIISEMLTHTKISEQLSSAGISEAGQETNKTARIFYALKARQEQDKCGNNVLAFVVRLLNPKKVQG